MNISGSERGHGCTVPYTESVLVRISNQYGHLIHYLPSVKSVCVFYKSLVVENLIGLQKRLNRARQRNTFPPVHKATACSCSSGPNLSLLVPSFSLDKVLSDYSWFTLVVKIVREVLRCVLSM